MKRASRFSYLFVALTLCALLGSATVANAGSRHLKRQRIAKGASVTRIGASKLLERFAGDASPAAQGGFSLATPLAPDAERTWNNTGTDFNAAGSWTGGSPAGNNVAGFNAAAITQPNLSANISTSGLYFHGTGVSGYDVTSTGGFVLTLTGQSTSGSGGTADSSAAAIRGENTSGTNTIDAAVTLASSTSTSTFFQAAGGRLVVNGIISGSGLTLSMRGGGTIELNGANTFSGGSNTNTAAGQTVVLGNDSALGTGTFSVNVSSTIQAGTGGHSISNAVVLAADTTIAGADNLTLSGNITSSGAATRTLTVNNSAATTLSGGNVFLSELTGTGRTLLINGSGAITIGDVIANFNGGAGTAGSLVYQGTNTLTLSGTNTFTGNTSIRSGTVSVASIGNSGANGNLGAGTTINLGSTTTTGTLLYTGSGETTSKILNLSGTTGGGTIDQSGTGLLNFTGTNTATGIGSKTLTLQGSTAGTGEISGAIVNGSGTTALVKNGTGTWTLSSVSNTFSGGTTINGGTLVAFGDGTLGTGNVSLTASGVTLTLQSGAVNNYIADTASISIVTGAVTNLSFTGTSDTVNGITLGGVVQTAQGTYGSLTSSADFKSDFFSGGGTLLLAIPEPSTWMMIGVGAILLAGVQRFRRK
jgi:autotransporter-associated beta strand protein